MEFFKRYAYIILGVVCVLALGGLFLLSRSRPSGVVESGQPLVNPIEVMANPPQEYTPIVTNEPYEPSTIFVHIVGAVRYPGVYEVPSDARINHVLQLAGGKTEDADHDQMINLAAEVQDGIQIRIPRIGDEPQEVDPANQPPQPGQQVQGGITAEGRVNINLATLAELQTLPGIGPVIAQNIIDFREANGGFNTIEELLNVARIGEATLERLRDSVAVD